MSGIYQCLQIDSHVVPMRHTIMCEPATEQEAITYLSHHGGGIYRNVLHNFDCYIKPMATVMARGANES